MTALCKLRCIFPLRSGLAEIECWAPHAQAEIVTHPFLGILSDTISNYDGRWVLTHRRSGKSVGGMSFDNVEQALLVATELDKIEDFKKVRIDSLEEGPVNSDEFMRSLRDQVSTKLAEFASRTDVEPRHTKLAPQSEQRGSPK